MSATACVVDIDDEHDLEDRSFDTIEIDSGTIDPAPKDGVADEPAEADAAGSCGCYRIGGHIQDGDACRSSGASTIPTPSMQIVSTNCDEVYPWCSAQYGCEFKPSTCICGKLAGSALDGYIILDEWDCTIVPNSASKYEPCVKQPW